jgi:hypothetical protein
MRLRAILKALYHGLLPWWMYESKKHYECSYWQHLWINVIYAWRWLTFGEYESDVEFEKQINQSPKKQEI